MDFYDQTSSKNNVQDGEKVKSSTADFTAASDISLISLLEISSSTFCLKSIVTGIGDSVPNLDLFNLAWLLMLFWIEAKIVKNLQPKMK